MKWSAILLSLAASTLVAPATNVARAQLATDPNTDQVYIESVNYGGSGCPQGSASVYLSSDRKTFTVLLQQYTATVGNGAATAESRKNCQLNIALHYPGGFQYLILSSEYHGFVALDKGVTGLQKATYYFSGNTTQASTETNFKGPVYDDYLTQGQVPLTSTVWSSCGAFAALNINSQVRVENSANKAGTGLLTTDSIDGTVAFKVGIQWQACKV